MKMKFASALMIIVLSACSGNKQREIPPTQVPVVEIEQRDIVGYISFSAQLGGVNTNAVRPKISGYIKKVFVDEGEHVKAGQPLFELETNIQSENANSNKAQVDAAKANIAAAEASLNAAKVEVDKLVPLVEQGIISSIQLETAKANYYKAKGQLSLAKANYQSTLSAYKGVLENIKFATVTSPISGIVGSINYLEGALVSANDPKPLTQVSDVSAISAYFSLNEKYYIEMFQKIEGADIREKIAKLPLVDLELANGTIYDEKGKIDASTGQIDPTTGNVKFRVHFDNKKGMLSNGSTGIVKIPRTYKNVMVVPESATFEQQGVSYVFKIKEDTARMTAIHVLARIDKFAIIENGIAPKDIVVANGVTNIRNNTRVMPKKVNMDSLIMAIKPIR